MLNFCLGQLSLADHIWVWLHSWLLQCCSTLNQTWPHLQCEHAIGKMGCGSQVHMHACMKGSMMSYQSAVCMCCNITVLLLLLWPRFLWVSFVWGSTWAAGGSCSLWLHYFVYMVSFHWFAEGKQTLRYWLLLSYEVKHKQSVKLCVEIDMSWRCILCSLSSLFTSFWYLFIDFSKANK